jgi:hypothetical protein
MPRAIAELIFLLSLPLLVAGRSWAAESQGVLDALDEGVKLHEAGKPKEAIRAYDRTSPLIRWKFTVPPNGPPEKSMDSERIVPPVGNGCSIRVSYTYSRPIFERKQFFVHWPVSVPDVKVADSPLYDTPTDDNSDHGTGNPKRNEPPVRIFCPRLPTTNRDCVR